MKTIPPEPEIDLYEQGFSDTGRFGRKQFGERLSELVEKISDPLVIAIDGAWGDGKTFFLKRWVGAHTLENDGQARTIYFDAYAHDYLEDPLTAITGVLSERFAGEKDKKTAIEKAKAAAGKLWRPALRIGLAAGTAGLSEITAPAIDAALDAGGKEVKEASEEFWKKEDGKRAAMRQFLSALQDLTDDPDGEKPEKIVVVVDELDRCRPSFALATLEVMKHFFEVPNVHFVLGVNLKELQNSVKAQYGAGVNARLYLQKFFSLTLTLPTVGGDRASTSFALEYFVENAKAMQLDQTLSEKVHEHLKLIYPNENLTMRGAQRLLTNVALMPRPDGNFSRLIGSYLFVIAGLTVMKVALPDTYEKAKRGDLKFEEVIDVFQLDREDDDTEHLRMLIRVAWESFLSPETLNTDGNWGNFFDHFGMRNAKSSFLRLFPDYLEFAKPGLPD